MYNVDLAEGRFKKAISDFADGIVLDQHRVYENIRLELKTAQAAAASAYDEAEANRQIIRRLENELLLLRRTLEKSDIVLARQYRESVSSGKSIINDALSLMAKLRKIDIMHGFCGIYFLVDANEIIYIGQSVNCAARIAQHAREEKKSFDSAYLLPCPESRLNDFEAALIEIYNPRDNGKHKNGRSFSPRITRPIDAVLSDIELCANSSNGRLLAEST